jgi:anthranilate/para-aminobenzoate synthase component I
MVCRSGRASVQAGAGIVADSQPELEDKECWNKARARLAAVGPARRLSAQRQAVNGRAPVTVPPRAR